jgi:hypothetical protein
VTKIFEKNETITKIKMALIFLNFDFSPIKNKHKNENNKRKIFEIKLTATAFKTVRNKDKIVLIMGFICDKFIIFFI